MEILIDQSPKMIAEKSARFDFDLWQLRTPLTGYAISNKPYGLDNGCFAEFKRKKWESLVKDAEKKNPIFICLPDIVGDARRTLDLFEYFSPKINGLPKALVLQDGIGNFSIPWDEIQAVFVGGSDSFKFSDEAINACKVAKMLSKWVHVGRVNTPARVEGYLGLGDSIDGSGISRYDHMLKEVIATIKQERKQGKLF